MSVSTKAAATPRTVANKRPQPRHLGLDSDGIYNAVCPRDPRQLKNQSRSWKFKRLQRRRAQTEGRISIVKNVFLGQRLRSKGFAHRELPVSRTVLVHDLWVLARMRQKAEAAAAQPKAA